MVNTLQKGSKARGVAIVGGLRGLVSVARAAQGLKILDRVRAASRQRDNVIGLQRERLPTTQADVTEPFAHRHPVALSIGSASRLISPAPFRSAEISAVACAVLLYPSAPVLGSARLMCLVVGAAALAALIPVAVMVAARPEISLLVVLFSEAVTARPVLFGIGVVRSLLFSAYRRAVLGVVHATAGIYLIARSVAQRRLILPVALNTPRTQVPPVPVERTERLPFLAFRTWLAVEERKLYDLRHRNLLLGCGHAPGDCRRAGALLCSL